LSEPGFGGILGINGITANYINRNETKKFSATPLRPLRLCGEPDLPDTVDEGYQGVLCLFCG